MGLGDLVQKAVYLGVGLASLASEKATEKLAELRVQAQKLADEMVERGEMTTEEARRFVDDMISKAQETGTVEPPAQPSEPRRIEIVEEDEPTPSTTAQTDNTTQPESNDVEAMRQRVMELQEELRRLKKD